MLKFTYGLTLLFTLNFLVISPVYTLPLKKEMKVDLNFPNIAEPVPAVAEAYNGLKVGAVCAAIVAQVFPMAYLVHPFDWQTSVQAAAVGIIVIPAIAVSVATIVGSRLFVVRDDTPRRRYGVGAADVGTLSAVRRAILKGTINVREGQDASLTRLQLDISKNLDGDFVIRKAAALVGDQAEKFEFEEVLERWVLPLVP